MKILKILPIGHNQAVRLPKAWRFNSDDVTIKHFTYRVLLLPIENPWQLMQDAINEFETGFCLQREAQE